MFEPKVSGLFVLCREELNTAETRNSSEIQKSKEKSHKRGQSGTCLFVCRVIQVLEKVLSRELDRNDHQRLQRVRALSMVERKI
ncbi:hypothetical protein OJAV_G00049380 [Oryzias javanicus]|uniref:Uncharacterized protein n=1 Tax=Oryzias javanicus TaxID=123683 RepID=A0A437DEQ5_ORYJA|nr:hypothetical protein OJAV_G00049380 [Oryzias javanicus]